MTVQSWLAVAMIFFGVSWLGLKIRVELEGWYRSAAVASSLGSAGVVVYSLLAANALHQLN
jgi:hypothetical protein